MFSIAAPMPIISRPKPTSDPASAGRVAPISPARPSLNRPRFSMKIAAATSRSTCADSRTVET